MTGQDQYDIREVDVDQYGRVVAQLRLPDGQDFARVMVGQGFSCHYVRYSTDLELVMLEAEAKEATRGVWSFGVSQRPEEFRAKQRTHRTTKRLR